MVRLYILIAFGALLVVGCGALGGSDTEAAPDLAEDAESTGRPTPLPTHTPRPPATPIPKAVAAKFEDARNLIWVYLSQCISFDVNQLQAELVQDDWYVNAGSGSPQGYGIWRVNALTGALDTHDHAARQWKLYVNSECNDDYLLEHRVVISTPAPTPVLTDSAQAVATLWTYLARCYSDLPATDLEATWDPGQGEWVVITGPGAETDYGVWRVQQDATISPDNFEARNRKAEVDPESCTLKVTLPEDAVATVASYLAKCFFGLNPGDLVVDGVIDADGRVIDASGWVRDINGLVMDADSRVISPTWIVKTKENAETNYGRWRVRRDSKLFPIDSVARIRDEEVRSESCTGGIFSEADARHVVWTHLVECSPTLPIEHLKAKRDPSNGEWVVITDPDFTPNLTPDHGVWRVQRDATLSPVNREAETRDNTINKGKC